jgi:hypothetical protein
MTRGTVLNSVCFKKFVLLFKVVVMQSHKLNALQLELLNVYSFQPNQEDLLAIKQLLAKYFSGKLQKNIQAAISENNITEEDLDRWLNE